MFYELSMCFSVYACVYVCVYIFISHCQDCFRHYDKMPWLYSLCFIFYPGRSNSIHMFSFVSDLLLPLRTLSQEAVMTVKNLLCPLIHTVLTTYQSPSNHSHIHPLWLSLLRTSLNFLHNFISTSLSFIVLFHHIFTSFCHYLYTSSHTVASLLSFIVSSYHHPLTPLPPSLRSCSLRRMSSFTWQSWRWP